MRLLSWATIGALSILIPSAVLGQTPPLTIANYRLVSGQPASGTNWKLTYQADIVNTGPAWGNVTAKVSSTDPFTIRVLAGLDTLIFNGVPANGQATSTNTFSILGNPSVPLDPSKLHWTYVTVAPGPRANPGPNQTVPIGKRVVLNGTGSTNASGIGTLTYHWSFVSRPPGSAAVLSNATSPMATFTVDVLGNFVAALTVTNGQLSDTANVTVSTSNTPPVAFGGPDQWINAGAMVQLDGSGSTDVDGNLLTYQWSLTSAPAGSLAVIIHPNIVNPTFTTDLPGTYVVQLIVFDGAAYSTPDTINITTNIAQVPMAFAGPNQTAPHNSLIQLNGAGTDPQNRILTFKWSLLTAPPGSQATLSSTGIPSPTLVVDLPGTYVAQLIVNNGSQDSAPSAVTITTTNTPPVANAGPNQSLNVGRTALLTGLVSTDADHDSLTYSWAFLSRPAGSAATLSGANSAVPNFVPDLGGTYVVQLIVSDSYANSIPATVTITVATPTVISLMPGTLDLTAPGVLTLHLSSPAGPGGIMVTLISSNPNAATVPATVAILEGAITVNVPVSTGVLTGSATITASSAGLVGGSATVNYTRPPGIVLSAAPVPVALNGTAAFPVSLTVPAPAGGVVVTLVSSDTTKVKFQSSAAVTIPAGATTPATQPLIKGVSIGTSTITASAPGYPTVNQNAYVTQTIAFWPNAITLPFASSTRYTTVLLTPGVAPAAGLTINLSSDNTNVAQVPATITIPAGASQVQVQVKGITGGTTTIHASLPPYIADTTASVTVGN